MTVQTGPLELDWLGYATLRIAGPETVVYVDPGRYGVLTGDWSPDPDLGAHPPAQEYDAQDGDVVFVTHLHHYDPDGIERVAGPDATVVLFEGIDVDETDRSIRPPADLPHTTRVVDDATEGVVDGVPFFTVPAYNESDGPRAGPDGTVAHPPGFGCGYLITVADRQIFWPGDSDALPGHGDLTVDVFVPPISGAVTMDEAEAAELAGVLRPDLTLPIHYNTFDLLGADAGAFIEAVASEGVPVALDS